MPRAGNARTARRPANSGRRLSRREAPVVVAGIGAGKIMSAFICEDCEHLFDSDDDPDCFVPAEGGTRIRPDLVICEHCRDRRGVVSEP